MSVNNYDVGGPSRPTRRRALSEAPTRFAAAAAYSQRENPIFSRVEQWLEMTVPRQGQPALPRRRSLRQEQPEPHSRRSFSSGADTCSERNALQQGQPELHRRRSFSSQADTCSEPNVPQNRRRELRSARGLHVPITINHDLEANSATSTPRREVLKFCLLVLAVCGVGGLLAGLIWFEITKPSWVPSKGTSDS